MSYEDRLGHLQHGLDVLLQAFYSKQLPDLREISSYGLETYVVALTSTGLAFVLAIPKSRRLLLETLEAIFTIACLIFLIGIVIGLPFGEWHVMHIQIALHDSVNMIGPHAVRAILFQL
jgi:hypothetical protein